VQRDRNHFSLASESGDVVGTLVLGRSPCIAMGEFCNPTIQHTELSSGLYLFQSPNPLSTEGIERCFALSLARMGAPFRSSQVRIAHLCRQSL
jgi:hypothetical protein